MLRKLYKDLLEQDFWPVKIYPLLNLYEKYQEQGKVNKFFEFLEKISPDYETDQIKELILCEEENIDIDFMTQEFAPAEKMREIRLFLMENNKEKEAYEIAQEFFGYWTSSQIAVIRKFRANKKQLSYLDLKRIMNYIQEYKIYFMPLVETIFSTCEKLSLENFWNFLYSEKTLEYIKLYNKNDYCYEGDMIFFDFYDYCKNITKELGE